MKRSFTHILGIDEAGRGPLAGPVAVGIAAVKPDFDWGLLPYVNDSKLLTERKRKAVFMEAFELQRKKMLWYTVSMVSAPIIDRVGIVPSIRLAIKRGLDRLQLNPEHVEVKLDGSLVAPKEFIHQETIIKGDQKEKVIGLASILAKVTRDKHMQMLSRRYPLYALHEHKGYGTEAHRNALRNYGPSEVHRLSFIHNIVES